MNKLNIWVLLSLGAIFFFVGCNRQKSNVTTGLTENIQPAEFEREKTSEELFAEQEQRQQQLLNEQVQILEKELVFFDKSFDTYSYCKTEAEIQNLLGLFGAWAALIKARENSEDAEIQKLVKQLKDKVIKCQEEAFPILRQEYSKVIDNEIKVTVDKLGIIGGTDIEYVNMQVSGNKNIYATFSWWGFISDNNKAIFQRKIFDTLVILRFTKAKMQFNSSDSEPSYFNPFQGKDTDLIVL